MEGLISMSDLADNLGASLGLKKLPIGWIKLLKMSHFRLANFEPVLRPSYVIYERNDWHHRVRIACTNRVICQNFRKIFFQKYISPLYWSILERKNWCFSRGKLGRHQLSSGISEHMGSIFSRRESFLVIFKKIFIRLSDWVKSKFKFGPFWQRNCMLRLISDDGL